jgi:hypothetical protein
MRHRVSLALFASLGVLGALAPSASGAANPEHAPCIALFTSNQPAGEVGTSASSNAREARPFGLNVISFSAQQREPCE